MGVLRFGGRTEVRGEVALAVVWGCCRCKPVALWWEGRYVNHLKNANFAEYEECAFCLPREHLQESDGGVYIQENGSGRRV